MERMLARCLADKQYEQVKPNDQHDQSLHVPDADEFCA